MYAGLAGTGVSTFLRPGSCYDFSLMLTHLRITNFALLEEVELDLKNGLSFLTGETGAGKSIFIDAVCRLLGSRATQDDVRSGEAKAILEAIFSNVPAAVLDLLSEWQIDPEEEGLILRREIHANGRSRMMINNCSVTLQQLRRLAPFLIDLFGQNEHQTLLDPESQQQLYDHCIGIGTEIRNLIGMALQIAGLQKEWRALREREQQRQRNIDLLKYQIKEIEEVQPSEHEESELQNRKVLLQNSERIHSSCESLLEVLLEKDESLASQLKDVQKTVDELSNYRDDLAVFSNRLIAWQEDVTDLVHHIDVLRRGLDFEEGSLDEIESRLDAFQRLKKKYGPTIAEVLIHLARCKEELQIDLTSEEREEELIRQTAKVVAQYEKLAETISKARQSEASRNLREEPGMQDPAAIMEKTYPSRGWEQIGFEIEPNPGEGFRELSKIASGGELSRFMLALKVVGQTNTDDRALIFDEIDAGIGGRVAYQVGERLKRLSRTAQVLCVTHLPQVAAFGDHHYQIQKLVKHDRTITVVTDLDEKRRIEELARMISGSEVTETALRHARELRDQVG
jgi:DNA repair protein RecN (Recombination protein N)